MSTPIIGTILETGNILSGRIWEVTSTTGKTILVTELEWSKDIIGQPGCMFLTGHTERLKIRDSGLLWKKAFGTFSQRQRNITVLPRSEKVLP